MSQIGACRFPKGFTLRVPPIQARFQIFTQKSNLVRPQKASWVQISNIIAQSGFITHIIDSVCQGLQRAYQGQKRRYLADLPSFHSLQTSISTKSTQKPKVGFKKDVKNPVLNLTYFYNYTRPHFRLFQPQNMEKRSQDSDMGQKNNPNPNLQSASSIIPAT